MGHATFRAIRWASLGFFLILVTSGCHHNIAFEDIEYKIEARQYDAALVLVIDADTLNRTVPIRSFMTGAAHSWDAQPGLMLQQVADVELPQLFNSYIVVGHYQEPGNNQKGVTLQLTVPQYTFADFRATVTIRAIAYGPGKQELFNKTYGKQGITQGGKMFWGGAFAMKSAVRQSSFDAYKQVFAELRKDLSHAMEGSLSQ